MKVDIYFILYQGQGTNKEIMTSLSMWWNVDEMIIFLIFSICVREVCINVDINLIVLLLITFDVGVILFFHLFPIQLGETLQWGQNLCSLLHMLSEQTTRYT